MKASPAEPSESPELRSGAASSSTGSHELGLADVTAFVSRHLWLLIGVPLITVAATVAVSFLLPRQYQATATLLVSQLELESDIEGQPLPVYGLQWILESERVLRAAEERIELESGQDEVTLEVGRNVETEMRVRRREGNELAPMIQVSAVADSADMAILVANSWVDVFVEHLTHLREAELESVVEAMSSALGDAEARLREVEATRSENREQYEKDRAELAVQFRQRVAQALKRHEERLASSLLETSEQLRSVPRPGGDPVESAPAESRAYERVLSARLRLADLSERIVLLSNVVPESVVIMNRQGSEVQTQNSFAFSEEVSTAFLDLGEEVLSAERELLRLSDDEPVRDWLAELARIQERSSSARSSQEFARAGDLQLLERRYRLDEEALERRFTLLDNQLDREVTEAAGYRASVSKRYNEALVSARAQSGLVSVRTAAEAMEPRNPISRNQARRAAVAALVGLLLAVALALFRDVA